jgi:hypothetical protein
VLATAGITASNTGSSSTHMRPSCSPSLIYSTCQAPYPRRAMHFQAAVAFAVLMVALVGAVSLDRAAFEAQNDCPAWACKENSDCRKWGNCTTCDTTTGVCALPNACGEACSGPGTGLFQTFATLCAFSPVCH